MPMFRCFIVGENFPGSLLGQSEPVGFHTTRFVDAQTPDEAEMLALQLLREDPVFERVPPGERTLAARIYFESIEEIDAVPGQGPGQGCVFFPMEA